MQKQKKPPMRKLKSQRQKRSRRLSQKSRKPHQNNRKRMNHIRNVKLKLKQQWMFNIMLKQMQMRKLRKKNQLNMKLSFKKKSKSLKKKRSIPPNLLSLNMKENNMKLNCKLQQLKKLSINKKPKQPQLKLRKNKKSTRLN